MVNTYVLRSPEHSLETAYDGLSDREKEVLLLAAVGPHNREIAKCSTCPSRRSTTTRANIMEKLGFHDRVELLKSAIRADRERRRPVAGRPGVPGDPGRRAGLLSSPNRLAKHLERAIVLAALAQQVCEVVIASRTSAAEPVAFARRSLAPRAPGPPAVAGQPLDLRERPEAC